MKQNDIMVNMTTNGKALNGIVIKDSTDSSVQSAVYSAINDILFLDSDFLVTLPVGNYTAEFDFGTWQDPVLAFSVIDTTPLSTDFIVSTPILKDAEGNIITSLANSYSIEAEVSIENNAGTGKNAVLVVALYDANNTRKNSSKSIQLVDAGKSVKLTAEFDLSENISGYYLKIFVLDSLDTDDIIHQISNTVTIN